MYRDRFGVLVERVRAADLTTKFIIIHAAISNALIFNPDNDVHFLFLWNWDTGSDNRVTCIGQIATETVFENNLVTK